MAKTGVKPRNVVDVCADCSAPEPCWASVNRGVFMCNDCAGVHRSLGRHVSQVKHLHRSDWHSNQLNMVNQLVTVGANSIWEHSLLDPAQMRGGKRKPNPNDSIHPTKSEFIRAKYEQLAFVHRPPRRVDEDLDQQLHSSVRTANLDTSLRLLSLGAHANFFHPDKGNTPVHVAAKAGQVLQVELLVTYGADPASFDSNKQTPENLARAEGHHDLADRLVELQYELSDRMSNFAWGTKPDHKQKSHYALHKAKDNGVGVDGRKRLQALSNQIFEELAMDVYDEIDRRETEKLWQDAKHVGGKVIGDHVAVPFLPLHPEYSPTRNQGRQKLARFTQHELGILTTDILFDIVRRQSLNGNVHNLCQNLKDMNHNQSGEDPIYDLPPDDNLDYQSIEKFAASTARPAQPDPSVPLHEFLDVKKRLFETAEEVTRLKEQNKYLSNKVTDLAKQNHELLKQKQQSTGHQSAFKPTDKKISGSVPKAALSPRAATNITRPTSVFNPNESLGSQSSLASADSHEQRRRTIHETQHGEIVPDKNAGRPELSSPPNKGADKSAKKPPPGRNGSPHNSVGSDYDNNVATEEMKRKESSPQAGDPAADKTSPKTVTESLNTNESNNTATMKETRESPVAPLEAKPTEKSTEHISGAKTLPKAEEIISQTVTKNIHSLLQAAQKGKIENYLSCAESILTAVKEIVTFFPETSEDSDLSTVINKLVTGAEKLKSRCQNVSEQDAAVNTKQITEEIIKNAYDIVKAAKELVTLTTKLQNAASSSST